MTHLTIKEILAGRVDVGAPVIVEGWLRTRRDSKAGLSFLQVHDGSCFEPIQVVAEASLPNYQTEILHLTTHCSVRVAGTLVESQGKGQRFEVKADRVEVVGWVENPDSYPVSAKRHTMEHLRTVAHLRPRTNTFGAVARVRDCLSMAVHRYFHEHGFVWVHTPIITTSDAEGAGAMFRVSTLDLANLPRDEHGGIDFSADFFGKPASLTVSGQLNVEAYCLALSRVYTFGPDVPRRELEHDPPPRRVLDDRARDRLRRSQRRRRPRRGLPQEPLAAPCWKSGPTTWPSSPQHIDKDCINRLETFINATFERMDYGDAIKALEAAVAKGHKFEFPVKWGIDLQSEHERYLTETLVGRPIVVMNYPKQIKAFYMRLNDDGKTVAAMDVLAPGIGEIIGGSQREERLDVLDARLDEMGLPERTVQLVPRPAALWHRAARRVRPRFRADDRLRHRHGQYPRRDPVPAHAGQRRVLTSR